MSQTATAPRGADLIGATLLFSLLLHGVLLLGITFGYVKPKPALPTLDVTLVDVANREKPDQAGRASFHCRRGRRIATSTAAPQIAPTA